MRKWRSSYLICSVLFVRTFVLVCDAVKSVWRFPSNWCTLNLMQVSKLNFFSSIIHFTVKTFTSETTTWTYVCLTNPPCSSCLFFLCCCRQWRRGKETPAVFLLVALRSLCSPPQRAGGGDGVPGVQALLPEGDERGRGRGGKRFGRRRHRAQREMKKSCGCPDAFVLERSQRLIKGWYLVHLGIFRSVVWMTLFSASWEKVEWGWRRWRSCFSLNICVLW